MSQKKDKNSMTVFKSDRHEDIAAICLAGIAVFVILIYMAFIATDVAVHATDSGIITEVNVAQDAEVKAGDVVYVVEITKPYWEGNVQKEMKQAKKIKAVTDGKVLKVAIKVGDKVSKGKTTVLTLQHVKGTLP